MPASCLADEKIARQSRYWSGLLRRWHWIKNRTLSLTEIDGYFGLVILVIAKFAPEVNHTCRFPFLHSMWLASRVTISQCWLVSLKQKKTAKERKWLFVSADVVGAGTRDEPPRTSTWEAREDKGDREGIPHTHPIPKVIRLELFLELGYSYLARCVDVSWRLRITKRCAKHVGRKAMKAQRDREHFWILKRNESALTWEKGIAGLFDNREISLTRSCRNLSALIKWEISPVYRNRSFV